MNAVIDTLRFSDKLQKGGFTSEQANVLARALGDELTEQLATKEDIKALKGDIKALKGDIKGLNAKFNYTMALIGLLVALELIPVAGMVLG